MISLQDIDVALSRLEQLVRLDMTPEAHDEALTCLTNARGMLRALGRDATASLNAMNDSLERLADISQGR